MPKRSLRVAALQTGLYPKDTKRALREGLSMAKAAATRKNSRLICFPEHWLTELIVEHNDKAFYGSFLDLAKDKDVYLNLGGIYEKDAAGKTFFLSPTISPRGEIISRQKKVHLFRRENNIALPGERFEPFEIDGIRAGVMVCHDVVFPESARTLVLKGAELLLNPSLIPARGIAPWKIYLMARALENRVPIIAPNPYLSTRVPGNSVIIGLEYEKAQGIMQVKQVSDNKKNGTKIITSTLAFDDAILSQREERLSERKTSAYFL